MGIRSFAVYWLNKARGYEYNSNQKFQQSFLEQIRIAQDASRLLNEVLDHPERAMEYLPKIRDLEHAGDHVASSLYMLTNETFITGIDKNYLTSLTGDLDDIVDGIRNVAEALVRCRITKVRPEAIKLGKIIREMIDKITPMIESVFTLTQKQLNEMIGPVKDLEEAGDLERAKGLGDFVDPQYIEQHSNDVPSIRILLARVCSDRQWFVILEELERTVDHCEDVADIVSSIVQTEGR